MKPWLKKYGKMRPDSEIKKLSQNWDEETWDNYLKKTVEVSQKELPLKSASTSERYSDQQHEVFYKNKRIDLKRNKTLKRVLNELVDMLPEKERSLIRMIYWQNLSVRKIADVMGVSRSTVMRWHKKTLDKLRREILISTNLKIQKGVL